MTNTAEVKPEVADVFMTRIAADTARWLGHKVVVIDATGTVPKTFTPESSPPIIE